MKHVFLFITTAMCFLHLACNKDSLEGDSVIAGYAGVLPLESAELFKMRAAFAKTVARALCDDDFRKYFKNNFCEAKDNHYKELFFALHIGDKVKPNGTTLRALLEQNMDDEVKELFDDKLIPTVLEKDPCVVLKLPDLFQFFDWNVDKTIPMVIPLTPNPETTFGKDLRYLAYFYNGKHDLIYDAMDYFHCTLKYSEDYFLMDSRTFINEKGISIYEILPQAASCLGGMRREMIDMATPLPNAQEILAVHKMDLFKLWRDNCGYAGPLRYKTTTCSDPNCIRKCLEPNESVLVLDTFQVNLSRVFEYQNNKFLDDAQTYSFVCWSTADENFMAQINIPSLPHAYFEARSANIALTETDKCKPPTIEYSRKELGKGKPFVINALIKDSVASDEFIPIRSDFLLYSDPVRQCILDHPNFFVKTVANSTECYPEQLDFVKGCYEPVRVVAGQSWFSVTY